MAGFTTYEGRGQIFCNGRLLAEATKASFSVKSNDNDVMTMGKGWAGMSDGPTTSEATITSAIPRKGFEKDFVTAVVKKETVKIVVIVGLKRIQFEGRFTNADWDTAVDSSTLISAGFKAGEPTIRG